MRTGRAGGYYHTYQSIHPCGRGGRPYLVLVLCTKCILPEELARSTLITLEVIDVSLCSKYYVPGTGVLVLCT